jgi:hypothetical protein
MKRRRRFGVGPVAVLSLLVCVGAAILWVRSYHIMDELFLIYKGDGSEQLSCLRGEFRFKHTLPQSGKRDWLARMRHRENRVVALPPRPWAEDRLSRTWWIFRYDDSVYDVKRVRQARVTVQSYWNSRIQPLPPASELTPAQLRAEQASLAQLDAAYLAAQRILSNVGYESYWAVTFPMWLLMVPAMLLIPATWILSMLRGAMRTRAGRCRSCGYDLTGNTSGVCPECGAKVTAGRTTAPTA